MAERMRCPVCEYDMGVKDTKVTRSSIGRQYDWTRYHCQRDDVWIELEIPVQADDK